jgi:hypothetical protein
MEVAQGLPGPLARLLSRLSAKLRQAEPEATEEALARQLEFTTGCDEVEEALAEFATRQKVSPQL